MMNNQRILITGASGFIGSHLTRHFLNLGAEVIAHCRNKCQLQQALQSMLTPDQQIKLEYLEADLTDPNVTKLSIQADVIIHLAAATDLLSKDFWQGMELSLRGTHHLLVLSQRNNIAKFIFFSTFQVYGNELLGAISTHSATKPMNNYALNHLVAENLLETAHRRGEIQAVILRPANIYGIPLLPTTNRWYLVPLCFCQEAYLQQQITLHSSGRQLKNFISLPTIATSCDAILRNYPSYYEIINIASAHTFSIAAIAEKVASIYTKRYKKKISVRYESELPLSSNDFHVDLNRLQSLGIYENDTESAMELVIDSIFDLLEQKHSLAIS